MLYLLKVPCLCAAAAHVLQILLQVQQMSSLPQQERYKGLWDALRKIPQREGGVQVCAWR